MTACGVNRFHRHNRLIFPYRALEIACLHQQSAPLLVQFHINRINIIHPPQRGRGFFKLARFFQQSRILLHRVRIAPAHFRIAPQFIHRADLVAFLDTGLGHKRIDAAGFNVIRIDTFNLTALGNHFIHLAILRRLVHLPNLFRPLRKTCNSLAGFAVGHRQKIFIERFRLHAQLLANHIHRRPVLRKRVDHIQQLALTPARRNVIANLARLIVRNNHLPRIRRMHKTAVDFRNG